MRGGGGLVVRARGSVVDEFMRRRIGVGAWWWEWGMGRLQVGCHALGCGSGWLAS